MVALQHGEQVIFTTRAHWLVLLTWLGGIGVFGAVSVSLLPLTGPLVDGEALQFFLGICVLIAWGTVLWDWKNRRLILTNRRLILVCGIVGKKRIAIPLIHIQNMSHRYGMVGWVFRHGDLLVESAGLRGRVVFRRLPRPFRIQKRIEVQTETLRRTLRPNSTRRPS